MSALATTLASTPSPDGFSWAAAFSVAFLVTLAIGVAAMHLHRPILRDGASGLWERLVELAGRFGRFHGHQYDINGFWGVELTSTIKIGPFRLSRSIVEEGSDSSARRRLVARFNFLSEIVCKDEVHPGYRRAAARLVLEVLDEVPSPAPRGRYTGGESS